MAGVVLLFGMGALRESSVEHSAPKRPLRPLPVSLLPEVGEPERGTDTEHLSPSQMGRTRDSPPLSSGSALGTHLGPRLAASL